MLKERCLDLTNGPRDLKRGSNIEAIFLYNNHNNNNTSNMHANTVHYFLSFHGPCQARIKEDDCIMLFSTIKCCVLYTIICDVINL